MIPRSQEERDALARELGYASAEACRLEHERLIAMQYEEYVEVEDDQ